jgi:hypothetical protein
MLPRGKVPELSYKPAGGVSGLLLLIFTLFVLLLSGCVTHSDWMVQATSPYCVPEEVQEEGGESWRAQCPDGRVFQCARDVTVPSGATCFER